MTYESHCDEGNTSFCAVRLYYTIGAPGNFCCKVLYAPLYYEKKSYLAVFAIFPEIMFFCLLIDTAYSTV